MIIDKTGDIFIENNYNYFHQLFDSKLDLTSNIICYLNLRSERDIQFIDKCEKIGRIAKFLSKRTEFEKCFTYFNINQMNESFIKYKMDKSSRIKINFSLELSQRIVGRNQFIDSVYMSVHSSQSIFKSGIFQAIDINVEHKSRIAYKFAFSKIIVKSLEWPHETDCKINSIENKLENQIIYSYDDCVNSCILDKIHKKYKCIQNNNNNDFGIDLLLENKTKNFKLCTQNITETPISRKSKIFCLRKCNQNCNDEYIEVGFHKTNDLSTTLIEIRSANSPLFEYEMKSKFSLFNYASNLGGIISMWFEFAFIDLRAILEKFIVIIIEFTRKLRLVLNLIQFFRRFIVYRFVFLLVMINNLISIIFLKVQKFNWKLLFKIFCLICFMYQSIQMTSEYLKYRTKVNVNIEDENMNTTIKSLPAISVCRSNNLDHNVGFIFLESKSDGQELKTLKIKYSSLFEKCDANHFSIKNCSIDFHNFIKILNEQIYLSDYLNTIDMIYEKNIFESKVKNDDELDVIISHYLDSKCYTIMSRFNEYLNNTINSLFDYKLFLNTTRGNLFIHDSSQLPSFPTTKLNSVAIDPTIFPMFYEKKIFKRLSAPYMTNCDDYRGRFKSQSHCVNEHLIEKFLRKNCLPKNNEMIAYVISNKNYTNFKHELCKKSQIEKEDVYDIKRICRKACSEQIYEIWSNNIGINVINLSPINTKYIAFQHNPEMEFMQYLANFGGLLGLWNGLSIIDLNNMIKNLLIFRKYRLTIFKTNLLVVKIFKKIVNILKMKVNEKNRFSINPF